MPSKIIDEKMKNGEMVSKEKLIDKKLESNSFFNDCILFVIFYYLFIQT